MADDPVEEFLAANPEVNEKAANILRNQTLEVQAIVLERGSLASCSNPNGALISRVNKAAESLGVDSGKVPGSDGGAQVSSAVEEFLAADPEVSSAVEEFLAANPEVGFKAAEILRNQAPEVQLMVLEMGSLEGCHKPAGALISRVNKSAEAIGVDSGKREGNGQADLLSQAVGEFLEQNPEVGEKAAAILWNQAPEVQQMVLERGGFEGCGNPPGALISRVNKAAASLGIDSGKGSAVSGKGAALGGFSVGGQLGLNSKGGKGGKQWGSDFMEQLEMAGAVKASGKKGCGKSIGSAIGASKGCGKSACGGDFMGQLELAGAVKGSGKKGCGKSIGSAIGASAAKRPRTASASVEAAAAAEAAEAVEAYLAENPVADKAAAILRIQTPDVIWGVLERGGLSDCNNPSGALISRINKTAGALEVGAPAAKTARTTGHDAIAAAAAEAAEAVEAFLAENPVAEKAAAILRSQTPDVMWGVLELGGLADCKNPSGALISRVNKTSGALELGAPAAQWAPKLGPTLGHASDFMGQLELAGAVKGSGKKGCGKSIGSAIGAAAAKRPRTAGAGVEAAAAAEAAEAVEAFLMENPVAEKAAAILRSQTPDVIWGVLERGGLAGCNNPSGALISRVNKVAGTA